MEVEEKRERLIVSKRPVLGHVESVGARNTTLEESKSELIWRNLSLNFA